MLGKIVKITFIFLVLAIFVLVIFFFINPSSLVYIYRGDDETSIWVETKYLPIKKNIADTDVYKFSDLQWSPNGKFLAYYDFVRLEWAEKEWALKIIDVRFFTTKTVFIGDYKTGEYKWLSNNTVRVYESAGSGVRAYRDININIDKPIIKVDDWATGDWTPEKTF